MTAVDEVGNIQNVTNVRLCRCGFGGDDFRNHHLIVPIPLRPRLALEQLAVARRRAERLDHLVEGLRLLRVFARRCVQHSSLVGELHRRFAAHRQQAVFGLAELANRLVCRIDPEVERPEVSGDE